MKGRIDLTEAVAVAPDAIPANSKGGLRIAKRIVDVVLWVELAVLAILVAATWLPTLFGFQIYGILTGSMEPNIPVGSLVLVDTNVQPSELEAGDVAAFDIGNGMVCTHRITENDVAGQQIYTKGDANADPDPHPTAYSDVFGKTVFNAPGVGTIVNEVSADRMKWIGGAVMLTVVLIGASTLLGRRADRE